MITFLFSLIAFQPALVRCMSMMSSICLVDCPFFLDDLATPSLRRCFRSLMTCSVFDCLGCYEYTLHFPCYVTSFDTSIESYV